MNRPRTLFFRPLPIGMLLVLAAAVLLTACGDDDDADAGGSPGDVAVPSERTDPSPAVLPDTFPVEFPVYGEATLTRADDFGGRFIVEWRVDDSTSDVADFYRVALATLPWSIQIESEEGSVMQIEFVGVGQVRFVGDMALAPIPDTDQTRVLLSLLEY